LVEIDVNKALRIVVRTGKVLFGSKSAQEAAQSGKAKLIILASNCPKATRLDIEYYSNLSEVSFYTFRGSSIDLGAACGKPFPVAVMTLKDVGDSDILKILEAPNAQ
jgi:large subunit ribosomal protein L30e